MQALTYILIVAVLCAVGAEKRRYDNHSVYKMSIENESQLSIVKYLSGLKKGYNLWKPFNGIGSDVHIMVSPEQKRIFNMTSAQYGFKPEVLISNVQSLIDEETHSKEKFPSFGWNSFHTLDEIYAWLDEILDRYPKIVSPITIGESFEGRPIRGIKISSKTGNPGIFIESNIHAREWLTSATATYFINELLTSKREELERLRKNYDWYIIPVFNVDGFVYTHEKDRMWRKTRQPVPQSSCRGTDANRNFDSHWMENGGASSNPCDETYAGPKPFSEPEALALKKFVISLKDRINIYLAFHTYGQYLLCPYGHTTTEFPKNYADLLDIGQATTNAIKDLPYRTQYTYGSTATTLYVASGTSVDWVYNEVGVNVTYTFEFRDKGHYGFVVPPSYIKPNGREIIEALIALVDRSSALGYI